MTASPSLTSIFLRSLRLGALSFTSFAPHKTPDPDAWAPGSGLARPSFLDALPCGGAAQAVALEGLDRRGVPGLLAAYAGYCLPGFALMAALGAAYSRWAGTQATRAALAGLAAVVPPLCLVAGLRLLLPGRRLPAGLALSSALALCAGMLFFLGLKPFSMLLGGAVLGVLLHKDPAGLPEPPGSTPYSWKLPVLLLLAYAVLAAAFFLADPALGRLYLLAGKAEIWSLGGMGGYALLFADAVRLRHWMDPPAFAALVGLGVMVPGPVLAASAFTGSLAMGAWGALAALAGYLAASCGVLLAAAPARGLIASCAWARKAVAGSRAVLGGMLLGLAARLLADASWDLPATLLAAGAVLALGLRVPPALAAACALAAGLAAF